MITQAESYTRLHGRWLHVARLASVAAIMLAVILHVAALPVVFDIFRTPCYTEPCATPFQTAVSAEDKLPEQESLHSARSVSAIETFVVLLTLNVALLIFWRRSDDWMAHLASITLVSIINVISPWPTMLADAEPIWHWPRALSWAIGLGSGVGLFYLFPDGRFVPRWTTRLAVIILFTIVFMAVSGAPFLAGIAIFVVILVTGTIFQIYRYRLVSGPIERQQTKWVVLGIIGMALPMLLVLCFGVLNPSLSPFLGNGTRSPQAASLFSIMVIYGWVFPFCFLPVTLAFSILRYRLWDVDFFINRTLVYGILSVGIVVTYILLVGLLGTLFKTNVRFAAVLLTAALTIPFFQSVRARVQRAVNRVTFGGHAEPVSKQEIEITQSEFELPLSSHWIRIMHIVWLVCAMLVAVVLLSTIPVYYNRYTHPSLADPYNLGQFNVPFQVFLGLGTLAESLTGFALAVLLFWRKPKDRMALFVSFFFLITIVSSSYDYFLTAFVGAQALPLNPFSLVTFPLWILLFCIFPDGQFVPRWTRWLFLVSILTSFSFFVIPFSILQYTFGPQFILVTYAQVYRYRRVSSDMERQQTKWAVFGWLMVMALSLLASLIYKMPSGPLINLFPLMLAIAILRSRLWNIDLILNRTLVYGALTAGIVALYVLLVGALSLLSQTTGNLLISLLATGLIAFLFQPLRERLQHSVNRLLYGDRDDPYAALSRLGRRLESSLAPETVLPTIVTTVREALKLPYAAIYLKAQDNESSIIAESASPSLRVENGKVHVPGMEREGLCMPLIHQGETLGYLVLGPRALNEAFGQSDLRLLDDLAPQVGVAVHSVRLTADLRRSREQLVLAREEERRRLRRDLHDDLAPTLASLGLTASTAADLIATNPEKATTLVKELQNEIRSTVGNIRRLVYDLRPPTLDELGLLAAIRERAMQYTNAPDGIQVRVEAPVELPALPAAVEVAVYRIVQEALENVSKHSQAHECIIRFSNHHGLEIEITDDGIGIPATITPGIGLRSIHERAEELGGSCVIERGVNMGTRVLARLPIGDINGHNTSFDR